jgi:hypothetical protein
MILPVLKRLWSFLAELSGVLSSLALFLIYGSKAVGYVGQFWNQHPFMTIVTGILVFSSFGFLIYSLRRTFSALMAEYSAHKVKQGVDTFERAAAVPAPKPEDLIPQSKLVEESFRHLELQAKQWSSDAELDSHNIYVKRIASDITFRTQVYFVSSWKREKLVLYYPDLRPEFEQERWVGGASLDGPIHLVPKWREAALAAFAKVSSRLGEDFEMIINARSEKSIVVWFQFRNGALKDTIHFDYSNGKLVCREDKSERDI